MRAPFRSLMGLASLLVLAGTLATAQNNKVFTCSSDDGRLHSCRVDTDAPIQFVRQRSDAQCIQDQSYGIDRGGVWVTNGCAADFAVGTGDQAYNRGAYNNDGYYNQGTYNNGRDRDNDHDRDDQGYRDANGNWHKGRHHRDHDNGRNNNGTYSQNDPYNNGGYNNGTYSRQGTYQGPYNNGGYVGSNQDLKYYGTYDNGVTTCSARDDQQQTYCSTYGALSNARVIQQNGNCVRGRTWDINRDGLWVAGNCSAKFQVQR